MSTLTKILVVLLALSTIFLSGITVTYVGSAMNYKKAYEDIRRTKASLTAQNAEMTDKVNALQERFDTATNDLSNIKTEHQNKLDSKDAQLAQKETELEVARTKLDNANIILSDYAKTVTMNDQLRKEAKDEVLALTKLRDDNKNKINELQDQIVDLSAKIAQLDDEKNQLIKENTKFQNELDRSLMSVARRTGIAATSSLETAPATRDLDLEGVIMEVKPAESLASISIGSAHGVKTSMRFHVIRNNSFVCDIVISQVDADQASGYLDLVTDKMPKAGDKVKTNF